MPGTTVATYVMETGSEIGDIEHDGDPCFVVYRGPTYFRIEFLDGVFCLALPSEIKVSSFSAWS